MYVKLNDGVVVNYPYTLQDLRRDNPNTSFPAVMDVDTLAAFNVATVALVPQPTVDHTQRAVEGQPKLVGDQWTQTWTVEDLSAEDIAIATDAKAAEVRAGRNAKLAASDWTQIADAPVDSVVWAAYRQALRDITSQPGFPWNVDFPEQPE